MLRQYIDLKKSANVNSKIDQLSKYFQSIDSTDSTVRYIPYIKIRLKSQISLLVHNADLEAETTSSTPMPTNSRSPILDPEPTYHSMSFPTSYSSLSYPITPHNMSQQQNQVNNQSHDVHDKNVFKNFY